MAVLNIGYLLFFSNLRLVLGGTKFDNSKLAFEQQDLCNAKDNLKFQVWLFWQLPYCPSGCEFKQLNDALQNPRSCFALWCCSSPFLQWEIRQENAMPRKAEGHNGMTCDTTPEL